MAWDPEAPLEAPGPGLSCLPTLPATGPQIHIFRLCLCVQDKPAQVQMELF